MFRTHSKGAVAGLAVTLAVGGLSLPAVAATATATMAISANVQATCLIGANPLSFGTYTGLQARATTTITVTCTNTTPYNVSLNQGTATGASTTTRQMSGTGGALLSYSLFSDTLYSVNWGDNVGVDTVGGTGSGSAQTLTVYGQVPGGQYVTPGAYTDTVTATVSY